MPTLALFSEHVAEICHLCHTRYPDRTFCLLLPLQEWGARETEHMFNAAITMSVPLTFGPAAYKAYVVPTLPKPKAQ